MKRTLLTFLSCVTIILMAASCQKAELGSAAPAGPAGEQLTITAGIEDDGIIAIDGEETVPETKTIRVDNKYVWWKPGDSISLFYGSGEAGGSKFTSINTENAAKAQFTGSIGVITGGDESGVEATTFWGIYPYSTGNSCSGSYVNLTVPETQESEKGTFAPGQWPTVGKAKELALSFKNVACGYKFTVSIEGIDKVVITAKEGFLSGKIKVSMDSSGTPTISTAGSNSNSVRVKPKGGGTFMPGVEYYVTMIYNPSFAKGIEWKFYRGSQTASYSCKFPDSTGKNEYPSGRGKFKVMSSIDEGLWPEEPEEPEESELFIPHYFSASYGTRVYFSRGNLYYDGNTWDFEANQYDYRTYYSNDVGPCVSRKDGLVGVTPENQWGTFSWVGYSATYTGIPRYGAGHISSRYTGDVAGERQKGDWGAAYMDSHGFAVQGSGRQIVGENWFTPLKADMDYILNKRANAAQKVGYAQVNGVNGIILLPDIFKDPNKNDGLGMFCPKSYTGWSRNIYNGNDWEAMESAGAVFLPAVGYRAFDNYLFSVLENGHGAYYWTCESKEDTGDPEDYEYAYGLYFTDSTVTIDAYDRWFGGCVRLMTSDMMPYYNP